MKAKTSQESAAKDAIVFFDGQCAFCHSSVLFLFRHDRRKRLCYAPLQGKLAASLLQGHGIDPDNLKSLVFYRNGKSYERSLAGILIACELGGVWRLALVLLLVPRPIRDSVYDWIASHRHSLLKRKDVCSMPSEAFKERILE